MIANTPLKNAIGFCLRMFSASDPQMPHGVQLNLGPGRLTVLARGSRGCCQLVIPVVWHTDHSMFVLTRAQAGDLYESLPNSGKSDLSFPKSRLVVTTGVRNPKRIDRVPGHVVYADWHGWFDVSGATGPNNYWVQHLAVITPVLVSVAGPDTRVEQGSREGRPLILTSQNPELGGFISVRYALPSLPRTAVAAV